MAMIVRPFGRKGIGTIGPKMNELPTVLPNVRTIRPSEAFQSLSVSPKYPLEASTVPSGEYDTDAIGEM